jgi:VWFA-related protein
LRKRSVNVFVSGLVLPSPRAIVVESVGTFAMRILVVLPLLMLAITVPTRAARRLTVEQLQQELTSAHGKPDNKVAQLLSSFELVERLDAERLSRWQAEMPGPESRRSLVLLADLSAFLDPPASEIPATATPDLATQRELIAATVDSARRTMYQLPNFLATRDTIRFEDSPSSQRADSSFIPYKPLHAVERLSATVIYRDGQEVDSGKAQARQSQPIAQGLITSGEFGPIIGTVLVDAAKGKLSWSHWESGARGPVAVFRYVVPREMSHYEVKFCCVPGESVDGVVSRKTGYHGEMAVDPARGAIMRLTLQADFRPEDKIVRADMLVEYGPVDIAGQTYICPVKSISIFVAPAPAARALDMGPKGFAADALRSDRSLGLQTKLNDVVFDQYHVFRSEARVLTGDSGSDRAAKGESASSAAPSESESQRAELARSADASAPQSFGEPSPAVPPVPAAALASPATNPAPAASEVTAKESAGIPEITLATATAQDKSFTLRVTTRLVDVGVVALDKKGRPVTDLKSDDFQIFDNGRRQTLRSFNGPPIPSTQPAAVSASQSNSSPAEPFYSNRRASADDPIAGGARADSGLTILLLDTASLSWTDLSNAREQMLKSLQALPSNERAGLYIQNAQRFQILIEATSDHARLVSILRAWMPTAQDLARAQETEQRNRQQFDEVQHVEDLQFVNGNVNSIPDGATTVDPQLRDFGSNPGRDAMATLVSVARHLAATPGRKNLVWIASDNVLADWTDKAVSSDKGSKHLGDAVVGAQEALNDAHVSLYPLDASQLESQAVNAALENPNVQLSPGTSAPPPPQGGGQVSGRTTAEMLQDTHPVQGAIQDMAQATGGRVFRRGGDLTADLKAVVEDGSAYYLLGFVPDVPADDRYHTLTIKATSRRGIVLRYRTGYMYSMEPATPKDRFHEAVWRPLDSSDIALSARALPAYTGSAFKLNIAINDIALQLQGGRWVDKLDIFVVRREADGLHAQVTGRSLALALLPSTYQSLLEDGIPFDEFIQKDNSTASVRFLVVDGNSGRMGSLTIPVVQTRP